MGKQKRSENTYQKINTLYKRDINNIIMQHYEWSCPEFEYLNALYEMFLKKLINYYFFRLFLIK